MTSILALSTSSPLPETICSSTTPSLTIKWDFSQPSTSHFLTQTSKILIRWARKLSKSFPKTLKLSMKTSKLSPRSQRISTSYIFERSRGHCAVRMACVWRRMCQKDMWMLSSLDHRDESQFGCSPNVRRGSRSNSILLVGPRFGRWTGVGSDPFSWQSSTFDSQCKLSISLEVVYGSLRPSRSSWLLLRLSSEQRAPDSPIGYKIWGR